MTVQTLNVHVVITAIILGVVMNVVGVARNSGKKEKTMNLRELERALKVDTAKPGFTTSSLRKVRHGFTNYDRLCEFMKPWQYTSFKRYVNDQIIRILKGEHNEIQIT